MIHVTKKKKKSKTSKQWLCMSLTFSVDKLTHLVLQYDEIGIFTPFKM